MKMSIAALIALSLVTTNCYARCPKKIKVAVLDTGLDLNDPRFNGILCPTGHKSFVPGKNVSDYHGHGTHVSGIIKKFAGNANYCLLIYKYYSESASSWDNLHHEIQALNEAIRNGAKIVNLSGGGPEFAEDEYLVIKNNPSVTFVVAAGNEHQNLNIPTNSYYPASYGLKNVIVVGNVDRNNRRTDSSNYGSLVQKWEMGDNVKSYLPGNRMGYMTGTSQSTAVFSGKLVDSLSKTCNY
jgi:subtilisin family serine protease